MDISLICFKFTDSGKLVTDKWFGYDTLLHATLRGDDKMVERGYDGYYVLVTYYNPDLNKDVTKVVYEENTEGTRVLTGSFIDVVEAK